MKVTLYLFFIHISLFEHLQKIKFKLNKSLYINYKIPAIFGVNVLKVKLSSFSQIDYIHARCTFQQRSESKNSFCTISKKMTTSSWSEGTKLQIK